jgi:hypothetical protein
MFVLDGNFALGCGPVTDYPQIHIFQCMLERTDAIRTEVLEQITFVLAYPTVLRYCPFIVSALSIATLLFNRFDNSR